jgi:signal peptidase I
MPGWLRFLLWFGGAIGLVAGVLRWKYVDFYTMPEIAGDPKTWSNAPNLEPGDEVLVWRGADPHVGDLVECHYDPNDATKSVIARVVALGGEKVELTESSLKINNHRMSTRGCQQPVKKVPQADGSEWELPCNNEEIGASQHDVMSNQWVTMPEVLVPAGSVFLLSDNRVAPWARDSRDSEIGPVPADRCLRRLSVRLWSKQGWSDAARRVTFLY